jgi:hypothetical protein
VNAAGPPRILRPEDVVALGEWLAAHRMQVDPAQLVAAPRGAGSLVPPVPLARMGTWLAPVFCASASEQEAFPGLYQGWLVHRGWLAPPPPPPVATPAAGDGVAGRRLPAGLGWLLVLLAVVAACAMLLWHTRPASTEVVVLGDGKALAGAEILTDDPAVTVRADSAGRTMLHYRHSQLPLTVSATHTDYMDGARPVRAVARLDAAPARLELRLLRPRPAAAGAPAPVPASIEGAGRIDLLPAPPPLRRPGTPLPGRLLPDPAALAACLALAMLPLAWWLYAQARRRGFLERMPAAGSTDDRHLSAGAAPALAAYARDLRYLSREMRRRRSLPSRALDVGATLAATLRHGGLPQLVFGSRAEPEYLVLVDRASAADHQAFLADEVIDFFHAQGVCIDRYTFDGDPRYCRHAPQGGRPLHLGPQSLELLFARHPGARLLVFSDGAGLVDRYTGSAAPWLAGLRAWDPPLLVTPLPRRAWGARERELAQAGLLLLPLDRDGLHRLGDMLRHERLGREGGPAGGDGRRKAYQRDIDLLLDRQPLPRARLATLLAELDAELGREGMAWLGACAVYPEIHWAVTLAVGDALHPRQRDAGYARGLAQLARLPWLRAGYMPDWLRGALVDRLRPGDEQAVRAHLLAFLALMKEDRGRLPAALALRVAGAPDRPAWRDALAGAAAWLRRRPPPANLRDAVFLRFMSGPRNRLAVDAGDLLARLFYRKGAALAGPRAWPLLAGMAGAGLLAWLVPPLYRTSPAVPGILVLPAPRLIAFSGDGTALAASSDAGSLVARRGGLGKGGNAATCPLTAGRGITLALEGNTVRYVMLRGSDVAERDEVDLDSCRLKHDPTPIRYYKTAPYEPMVPVPSEPPAREDLQDVLCAANNRGDGSIEAAGREGDPVACAYAANGPAWIGIGPTGVARLDTGSGVARLPDALPSAIGAARGVALNGGGATIAVAGSDGGLWLRRGARDWSRLADGAAGPVAVAADGSAVAFANIRREVEVWRVPLPSVPPARPATAARERPAAKPKKAPATSAGVGPAQNTAQAGGTARAAQQALNNDTAVPPSASPDRKPVTFSQQVRVGLADLDLNEKDRAALDAFVLRLNALEDGSVMISYYDVTGPDTKQYESGMKQNEPGHSGAAMAMVVRRYLIARGVGEDRITTESVRVFQQYSAREKQGDGAPESRIEVQASGYAPVPPAPE